ncbi:DUF3298 and DUF4163 domain-containing protein [Subsaximicrobium wynnwilliamsii]|uniref:DUF3298 and DUF4163 domain-containing protein n=1 Tax=Subsaximicrobium wynnwilliamsii TaxID=291179 RepID=A0A5C6ZDL4_9FLAO|nr:DUF3298 and DUF4163 domain-containing protein [Subsaximicrobium wynnwilliamsii]TXD87827.1 DUF3298 and DUF4163 domain-containing protein [Subsaximicrobium wynnwilliamsii]TXE01777.1 DUF3298 and DUF4163 domain-containing protein [Subsaximicrobium wynnwilliamsii]
MFNVLQSIPKTVKKLALLVLLPAMILSCAEEVKVNFEEAQIKTTEAANINFNYPKATGTKTVAERINQSIENYVANQTNMANDTLRNVTIDEAVKQFNFEYKRFKSDFPEAAQQWEAFVDGEVTYKSPELICIYINSYLDTGGAHGNTVVRFLNFDAQTGELLEKEALINDRAAFLKIVQQHFQSETKPQDQGETTEDFFFGKDFQLPESIGFNDEGVVILYNTYEIASYAQGITEFLIPYAEVNSLLKQR